MKLIRPSYEIWEQGPGIQGVYEMIERCGKISYKSDFKGGDAARRFVEARVREGHNAVLEFGTVYLQLPYNPSTIDTLEYDWKLRETTNFYRENKYSKWVSVNFGKGVWAFYVTTNYRVLVENNRLDDLKYLCEPTEYHEKRYTVKFITDIGVGREFLRHRVMSLDQESTRCVNYTKEKFGGECTFVIPPWISEKELATGESVCLWDGDWTDMSDNKIVRRGPAELQADPINIWLESLAYDSYSYETLISLGWKPEQARTTLPLSTKTEYALCGYKDAWVNFLMLRSDIAAGGKPHPQSLEIANPLKDDFLARGIVTTGDLGKTVKKPDFDIAATDANFWIEQ